MVDIDLNHLVHIDAASFRKKRKRPSPACVRCHEKKIKCDPDRKAHDGPCANCVNSNTACISHVDGRTRGSLYPLAESGGADGSLHRARLTVQDDAVEISDQGAPNPTSISIPHQLGRRSTVDSGKSSYDDGWLPLDPGLETTPGTSDATPDSATTSIVELPRFEAYAIDNLGSFAPSFKLPSRQRPSGAHQSPESPLYVDMSTRSTIDIEKQFLTLDGTDMGYLEAKGAFDLPPRPLQEDLIRAFFTSIHCAMPVINRAQFLSDFYAGRSQSRLLLFAIFTAGCRACRNPLLLDHTGTVRNSGLRFYKITKALLDTKYEQDKLTRIQALLLIVPWWDKKDDGGSNMRACAVDAINTAQSMGMHRWDQYPRTNTAEVSLWKRIWWTCFFRDVGVSTSHGLPPMLAMSGFDVEPLTRHDFEMEHLMVSSMDTDAQQLCLYSNCEIAFMIESVKVMEMQHHIQIEHFVKPRLCGQMTGSITQREQSRDVNHIPELVPESSLVGAANDHDLRTWLDRLPSVVRYDIDDVQGHQFLPAVLHIFYFTAIMLRYREKSVSAATEPHTVTERRYSQARGIAAATVVSKIMRNARAHGHILRFSGQLTNTLFNCLIFFLIESKSSDPEVRRDARNKYSSCLNMLYDFSQLWISASLIHRLFEALQAHMILAESNSSSERAAMSSRDTDRLQPLFPGLRISSDITGEYMKQLLQTDLSLTADTVSSHSPAGVENGDIGFTHQIPNTMWLEGGLDSLGFVGGSLPDTLNVDDWLGFLDFQQGFGTDKAIT